MLQGVVGRPVAQQEVTQVSGDPGSRTLGSGQPETWGLFRTKECIKDYLSYLLEGRSLRGSDVIRR